MDHEHFIEAVPDDRDLLSPAGELFSDMFAALLTDDPGGVTRELEEYASWYETLPRSEREAYNRRRGRTLDPRAIRGRTQQRSLTGEPLRVCLLRTPVPHAWFDGTRRVLWGEMFVGRLGRDRARAHHVLRGLAMEIHVLREERAAERRRLYDEAVAAGADPRFAARPLDWGEDYHDARLTERLRRRFGLPTPPPAPALPSLPKPRREP